MKSKAFLALGGLVLFSLGGLVAILASNWANSPPAEKPSGEPEKAAPAAAPADPPGRSVERKDVEKPPPPPKKVGDPERVRQNLRPGKTYVTHSSGALNVRGEDTSWGLGRVVTINYAFEARIDRQIESNDGRRIVELRRFRDVRAVKVTSRLEDLRLELGPRAGMLLAVLGKAHPKAEIAALGIRALDGVSARPVLAGLRWAGVSPEELSGLDSQAVHTASQVGELSGKSVRLTFVDGGGVVKVEPVDGEMTREERHFHFASSLLSDSLILPDTEVKVGSHWTVDGASFASILDPAMLSRTSGEVTLERANDHLLGGRMCRHLRVVKGRIHIEGSEGHEEQKGHFDPQGSLYFSPPDQVVIEARLKGKAKLERFSKNHLLFETRMRRQPELDLRYTCEVIDTAKGK